jgi:hypothetical protein
VLVLLSESSIENDSLCEETVPTVWDSAAQRCLYTLPVEGFHVPDLAWSPDSRTLAAALYRAPSRPGPAVVLWRFTRSPDPLNPRPRPLPQTRRLPEPAQA